jgi:hypothetical protein
MNGLENRINKPQDNAHEENETPLNNLQIIKTTQQIWDVLERSLFEDRSTSRGPISPIEIGMKKAMTLLLAHAVELQKRAQPANLDAFKNLGWKCFNLLHPSPTTFR